MKSFPLNRRRMRVGAVDRKKDYQRYKIVGNAAVAVRVSVGRFHCCLRYQVSEP